MRTRSRSPSTGKDASTVASVMPARPPPPWPPQPRSGPSGSPPCRTVNAPVGPGARPAWAACSGRRAGPPRPAGRRRSGPGPGRSWTSATTSSPHRGDGRPHTTASSTAGWVLSAVSTSSANTFSPPVLMHTESRPCSSMVPSGRHRARSPATAWRTAVDHREGRRGLGRVAQVAERHPAGLGQPAEFAVARLQHAGSGPRTAPPRWPRARTRPRRGRRRRCWTHPGGRTRWSPARRRW